MSIEPTSATEPEVPQVEETPEPQADPETPVEYYQLRKDSPYRELSRLSDEDPEFRQHLGTFIGQKAAREYQPQLRERDQRIAELESKNFALEVKGMSAEDIEAKVSEDRDWGKKYLDYVHDQRTGSTARAVPDDTEQVADAMNELVDWARTHGMPDEDFTKYVTKARNGAYGDNRTHWGISIGRMREDMTRDLLKGKPAPPAVRTTNPATTKGGPDLSGGSGGASTKTLPTSAKEFNSLPRAEQNDIISTPEGLKHVQGLARKG